MTLLFGAEGRAHYQMLLPETASAKLDQEVTILYQWGHPFEHQLFDAPRPRQVYIIAPGGKRTLVGKTLEEVTITTKEDAKVITYRFRFTPRQRGDYLLVLETPPIWMKAEQAFFQDTVKVVLHVEDQDGWDGGAGQSFEFLPLTRPYGLQPGLVFQAQLMSAEKPVPARLVEMERYNPTPPAELPADEQITRTAKTDPNGVVTCTLPEAGWWSLTAQRKGGQKERDGKMHEVRQRTTLWVFVDDKGKTSRGK
jgi:cobalt/nickel transport protein